MLPFPIPALVRQSAGKARPEPFTSLGSDFQDASASTPGSSGPPYAIDYSGLLEAIQRLEQVHLGFTLARSEPLRPAVLRLTVPTERSARSRISTTGLKDCKAETASDTGLTMIAFGVEKILQSIRPQGRATDTGSTRTARLFRRGSCSVVAIRHPRWHFVLPIGASSSGSYFAL